MRLPPLSRISPAQQLTALTGLMATTQYREPPANAMTMSISDKPISTSLQQVLNSSLPTTWLIQGRTDRQITDDWETADQGVLENFQLAITSYPNQGPMTLSTVENNRQTIFNLANLTLTPQHVLGRVILNIPIIPQQVLYHTENGQIYMCCPEMHMVITLNDNGPHILRQAKAFYYPLYTEDQARKAYDDNITPITIKLEDGNSKRLFGPHPKDAFDHSFFMKYGETLPNEFALREVEWKPQTGYQFLAARTLTHSPFHDQPENPMIVKNLNEGDKPS